MREISDWLRIYWLQILQVIISLIIGGNLAQQFSLKQQKSLAGKLARFTLALIFSAAYYALLFYLAVIFKR
ncbi:MAG: hypothetical protein GX060_01385 [Firmicutes bacterium]|nr:hypothetical protein [Bacillota bacterium]